MSSPLPLLCVSLNPAIDRRIRLPQFFPGEVNRASHTYPAAGGKAAHAAFAARALGAEVKWLGFLGGPEGENCRAGLEQRGVVPIAIGIAERTRTNIELIDESTGRVTEVLEPGPAVSAAEAEDLLRELEKEARHCALVLASGSLPQGLPSSWYAELIRVARSANRPVFIDTSGQALSGALSAAPSLIKPNREEAGALSRQRIETVDDAIAIAKTLQARGPDTVIISLGRDGAVVAMPGMALYGAAPELKAQSAVGSGDSFLAGWAVATSRGAAEEERLRLAIACGAANCLATSPGCISPETVRQLASEVQIRRYLP